MADTKTTAHAVFSTSSNRQPPDPAGDNRKAHRFALRVPVLFGWHGSKTEYQGGGFTCNLSACGMYVTCEGAIPPNQTIVTVEVLLPAVDPDLVGLTLKAQGAIVRAGGRAEKKGFAIAADLNDSLCNRRER